MPGRVIGTERLILRPPALSDVPTLFAFLGDAEAMRHTHVHESVRACRRHVVAHERQRRRLGYAPWVIATKVDGQVIGWSGIYDDPFEPGWETEVGYFFHPDAWGRGFATELVRRCVAIADRELMLSELAAFAHPESAGSLRVLEKAGFRVVRFVPGMDRFLFRRARRQD